MKGIFTRLKNYFFAGLLVVVPIAITIGALKAILTFLDDFLRPLLEPVLGFWPIGFGLIIMVVTILLIGLLTGNIVVKRFVGIGEKILLKIPVAKIIYSAVKQLLETFSATEKQYFQKVVALEYPSSGIWSIGFVNGHIQLPGDDEKKLNILVMTALNPTQGFFIMVPEKSTVPLNITVEEGMKWVISGGIIKPKGLERKPTTK